MEENELIQKLQHNTIQPLPKKLDEKIIKFIQHELVHATTIHQITQIIAKDVSIIQQLNELKNFVTSDIRCLFKNRQSIELDE